MSRINRTRWGAIAALPVVLAATCRHDPAVATLAVVDSVYAAPPSHEPAIRDGWGRPFQYRWMDSTKVLISPGPDGILGSADDLDFSPAKLAARARELMGCWQSDSINTPVGVLRTVVLSDSQRGAAPDFRAVTNLRASDADWLPWGADSVVVRVLTGPQLTEIRARVSDGALSGTHVTHSELGGLFRLRAAFSARRVRC